jgi:hypothetical protein
MRHEISQSEARKIHKARQSSVSQQDQRDAVALDALQAREERRVERALRQSTR